MDTNDKVDIRFLYLALHNMIKYRGNFLHQGDAFNQSDDSRIETIFNELNILIIELLNKFEDYDDYFKTIDVSKELLLKFKEVMLLQITKNDKKNQLKKLFSVENKTFINEVLIPLFVGSKCNLSSIYPIKDFKYEKCEISFDVENLENDLEEKRTKILELDLLFDNILSIKEVVDYYFLIRLLNNSSTLSEAMIKKYDEHNNDLKRFKKLIKEYLPLKYNECFRVHQEKLNNYVRYIGMNSVSSTKPERFSHCKRDEFYAYVSSLLKQINDEKAQDIINEFINKMENNNFLPRQNSDQNGSLPMQLNLYEMNIILNNQIPHYQFLSKDHGDGIKIKDKIISIFKFIIPYYVGPLNASSKRSWIVRNEEKIFPWNFEKVVDVDESAKKFIENMQRRCTYLKGENDYCLPKNSIIFSKYNCLSYLNKLNIDGSLISVQLKNEIFENVFLKFKKPTRKHVQNYLKSNYGDIVINTSQLKEIPEINCNMASYIKFKEIFGDAIVQKIDLIEDIIKDIVVFSDKKILEKRLYRVYGLEKEIVNKIKDLNYKDYSNLSKKLLNDIKIINPNTGEVYGNVISLMENSNLSLQEILYNPDYRLIDIVDEYNSKVLKESSEMTVEEFINDNISLSPIMKRPLIQAHTIISEVKKILKSPIEKYYVECTRTNLAEKKQTVSRYNRLKDLYKNCKSIALDMKIDLEDLKIKLDKNQDNLKSDIIYLYFTQLGKCMYTLENIDFDSLISNNNLYDIDHIYPQSLIKDDSISNRVLVRKEKNNEKQDNMLFELHNFLNKNAYKFYDKLRELNLISKEKYNRLTKKEITSGELDTFVNRQIVATNQAVKGLIQVLKLYDKVDQNNIVYSKAENITMARKLFDLPKSRTANNFHHAHDAYLNVVFGRIIHNYFVMNHFNSANDYYRFKSENKTTNVENLLKYKKYVNGKLLWDKDATIKLLNKNLYQRYDVNETTRTYNSNELFSKVTIKPAGNGIPMKENGPRSDVSKYGGITSYSFSKYIIIETTNKKGIKEYILEPIPKSFENYLDKYLQACGYENYIIKNDNIKSNVIIEDGNLKYCITGKSGNQFLLKNLKDRFFTKYYISIIKKIDKYLNNIIFKIIMKEYKDEIIISPARNNECNEVKLTRTELNDLFNEILNKYLNKVYAYGTIVNYCNQLKDIKLEKFTMSELIEINSELLKLLQTNSRKTANLKLLGLSSNAGTILISKKLTKGMKFIAESVTGYYKKILFEVPENGI